MAQLNPQIVKEKTIELAYAARAVIQQLASKDRTPEGIHALEILEDALTRAIPDAKPDASVGPGKVALAA